MTSGPRRPSASGAAPAYDPETLPIGIFGRPHGLRGELLLHLYNPGSEPPASDVPLLVEGSQRSSDAKHDSKTDALVLTSVRPARDSWLVMVEGIDSREAAAGLTNRQVRVPRSSLPPLDPGEFYIEDLWGCSVQSDDGRSLGTVATIFWNGAHDVLVVRGDRERLIPIVAGSLVSVDAPARAIVVGADWTLDEGDE